MKRHLGAVGRDCCNSAVAVGLGAAIRCRDQRNVAGGQILDVDIANCVGVGRVKVGSGGLQYHFGAVCREGTDGAVAIGLGAAIRCRDQRGVTVGQILDVDIAQRVGIVRIEVGGDGIEPYLRAVGGKSTEAAEVVALDTVIRGGGQGEVAGLSQRGVGQDQPSHQDDYHH